MIVDGSFELDFVDKGTPHCGIRTDHDGFKPFWEVQCLANGYSWIGTKNECVQWIAEFYLDYYYEKSSSEEEAMNKAKRWVCKCIKMAEAKELV